MDKQLFDTIFNAIRERAQQFDSKQCSYLADEDDCKSVQFSLAKAVYLSLTNTSDK